MSFGCIIDGVFNNCAIYSPIPTEDNVALYINNCRFNVTEDKTVIHVIGKPEKKVAITNCQIVGDQEHTITGIKLGDATSGSGCVNTLISNCYIFGLTTGVLLSRQTDVISINNCHFFRNQYSINCEDTHIRTCIDIFDNHFQGAPNESIYIYMNGHYVNIHDNIFEVPNRTIITFIKIEGGESIAISKNAFENTSGTTINNVVGIDLGGSCSNVMIDNVKFSGAFSKPIWIRNNVYKVTTLGKNIIYLPIGTSARPEHLITNNLIQSQAGYVGISEIYDSNNYLGMFFIGERFLSGSLYFYKTDTYDLVINGPFSWVKLELFEINNSKRHTIDLNLDVDSNGSIPDTLTDWNYVASTRTISFSCRTQTINTTILYSGFIVFSY